MDRNLPPLIRDVPVAGLRGLLADLGAPAYRGDQLAGWLYARDAEAWDGMTDLPEELRGLLAARWDLDGLAVLDRQVSQDGTRKHLFSLRDGHAIESVTIPMEHHLTFCLSSQVGCAMACSFCATARGGLVRNLAAGEIVEQVLRLRRDAARETVPGCSERAFNLVFMGMGEPLDNFDALALAIDTFTAPAGLGMSPRRITVSTSGHAAGMRRLLDLPQAVGLTVSVNGTDPDLRRRLMPVPGRTPLPEVLDLAQEYARRRQRRVTIAYVLIDDVNDGDAEAAALAELVRRRPFKVNLIPMNRIDERFGPPDASRLLGFQDVLRRAGVEAYIRISGGDDIAAACGQLREKHAGKGR